MGMDGFTYILLSVWFAWCQVFISGKLIHACYFHWCSIVEVVVDMLRVPSTYVAVTWLCAATPSFFLIASAFWVDVLYRSG